MINLPGEYYLQNVREMASGFLLKEDRSFQFFFSYGALDRYGSGEWSLAGDRLLLQSAPRPGNDFTLVESRNGPGDAISIRLDNTNPMLLNYTYVSLDKGLEGTWQPFDQQGECRFPLRPFESVSLLFEFCPERFSTLAVTDPEQHEYLFRPESWLLEVFFDHFSLQAGEQELTGPHPLLKGDTYRYSRVS